MNWKLGFWRIWLVVSLIWMICVVLISNPISTLFPKPIHFQIWGYDTEFPADLPKQEVNKALVEFLAHERSNKPNGPWLQYQGGIEQKVEETLQNYQPVDRLRAAIVLVVTAFAPPLFLLIFGIAIAWITSGFKSVKKLDI